jgi:hypothetical protein
MMPNFSRYTQEHTGMNGTTVPIAIPTQPTMQFLPASIVMRTTGQIWMISIWERCQIINITVSPAWIATPEGLTTIEDAI